MSVTGLASCGCISSVTKPSLGCHAVETHGTLDLAAFVHVPPMESYDALETGLIRVLEAL